MKIVAISDTHGQHAKLILPSADVIIHAGDVSKRGTWQQVKDFLDWFSSLPHRYKIFVAGNHDFFFEKVLPSELHELIPSNTVYLNDSFVEVEGIKIWGSPIQPWFHDWAFNRKRGEEIKRHWDLIPDDVDIVVTHGPMYGILDKTSLSQNVGCEDLKFKLEQVKPQLHICGHIHEAYGTFQQNEINCINASVLNLEYQLSNAPIIVEIKEKKGKVAFL